MSKEFKKYTVAAALPYANGPVHIGHLAGVYVPADIYVRYLRSAGKDVLLVGGSDELGIPITLRAKNEGVTPQEIVDRYHGIIKKSFEEFGISFDVYSRTSAKIHWDTSSEFFKHLYDAGVFIEKTSEQYYDQQNKQFLADRYIQGICPICSYDAAYGDQCERCGSSLSPDDLINPKSMLSGAVPIKKETKHWYLPMDQYEDWLKQWILEDHKEWKSNVYGQCKSWLDQGLKPRAMTRDLDWGIPVPLPDAEGKVLYVWFDAPIGYISATKEWAQENRGDWEPYWKDKDTKLVHFIGKDNIVFHCIIFPVLLKAHGDYILPENVPANEFLNLEGGKVSTSRNWAVWLHEYLDTFPNKQDVLRYTLCAIAPETKDSDFTWKDFQARNNNELVAILGNFINRTLVLTKKHYEGSVPEKGKLQPVDQTLIDQVAQAPQEIANAIEQFKFREAQTLMMEVARWGNKYLADNEPWKLIKTNPERVQTILNISLQLAANLTILAAPFLPFASEKLLKMMNLNTMIWETAGRFDLLKAAHQLGEPELLFEKIEDPMIQKQIDKLEATKSLQPDADLKPAKETITYDDFVKMDIRIGTIKVAEKVPKSKKLLKLEVATGLDTRIVVSGIAEHYSPEDIIGQPVTLLLNLTPRKIMGIESQGMILMAENNEGQLAFLQPDKEINDGGLVS